MHFIAQNNVKVKYYFNIFRFCEINNHKCRISRKKNPRYPHEGFFMVLQKAKPWDTLVGSQRDSNP